MNPETLLEPEVLAIAAGEDVVRVRQTCRRLSVDAGLALVDQTKLVTAASELALNALTHGRGGTCRIGAVTSGERTGVRVEVSDEGPGISDVDSVLLERQSSGLEVALGLEGVRRLVDDFDLETDPERGTRVAVVRWKR